MHTYKFADFTFSYLPTEAGLYLLVDPEGASDKFASVSANGAWIIDPDEHFSCYQITAIDHPAIFVAGLSIEVDLSSAFNGETKYVAHGSITCRAERASLHLRSVDDRATSSVQKLDIAHSLTASPPNATVAFSKWTIGWGTGEDRRVLRAFDIERATKPVR